MSVTCKVPELRFQEFSGEWEEKKLGDLTKINQGLQIAISERFTEQVKDSLFYITNEFLREKSKKKYFIKNPPASVVCAKNDVLMTRTGNTGQIVTGIDGAFHNNFFKIKYKQSINKDFLVYFLRLNKTQNNILKLAGTSTIPDLNHGDFYKIKINLPSKQEQEKIASFLSAVDSLIEQLAKKEKLLREYKKGVMQKIFSQEIRFKEDDGSAFPEWVESKLGNYGKLLNGLTYSPDNITDNGLLVLRSSNIQNQQILLNDNVYVDLKVSQEALTQEKDILICVRNGSKRLIGKSVIIPKGLGKVTHGAFMTVFRGKSNKFIAHWFQTPIFYKEVYKNLGATINSINSSNLKNFKTIFPSSEKEQTKIANFLSSLDTKIEQVSKQLKLTKEFKKALLQKMFV